LVSFPYGFVAPRCSSFQMVFTNTRPFVPAPPQPSGQNPTEVWVAFRGLSLGCSLETIDISDAVQAPSGLYVPVVTDVGGAGLAAIGARVRALAAAYSAAGLAVVLLGGNRRMGRQRGRRPWRGRTVRRTHRCPWTSSRPTATAWTIWVRGLLCSPSSYPPSSPAPITHASPSYFALSPLLTVQTRSGDR
jgi:hypothetical protein